jgi:hypothetical protein
VEVVRLDAVLPTAMDESQIPDIGKPARSQTIETIRVIPEYAELSEAEAEAVLDSVYLFAAIVYHYCVKKCTFDYPNVLTA